jgi:DNA topoisomerase VI subunit B
MFNFIGNALKFTPAGGTVSVEIKHHEDSVEHTIQVNPNKLITVKSIIEIIVSDTGIGISEENLGKIFDSFFQVQDHLKNTAGGTGLGLAGGKEMVKIHHGDIRVHSKLGEGTTFCLKIPVLDYDLIDQIVNSEMIEKSEYIKPQLVEINDEELSLKDHGKNKKGSKILIVEDNSDMRQYIGSNLTDKL